MAKHHYKLLLFAFLLFEIIHTANASVVITQVLYDPLSTESGGEAIEITNTGNTTVDISGWTIRTETSAIDAVIDDNTLLFGSQKYLIADTGWSEKRDDAAWRDADTEQSITLKNADSGVALFNSSTIVDAVGWGDPSDSLLFEGTAAPQTEPGQALIRKQDTDDNKEDFISGQPSFAKIISTEMEKQLQIQFTVISSKIEVLSTEIGDDQPEEQGIQVFPIPGTTRPIPIQVTVNSTQNLTVFGRFMEHQVTFAQTGDHEYSTIIPLSATISPGTYPIILTATSDLDTVVWTEEIEILGVVAFSLSDPVLDFGNITDIHSSRKEISITNLGNVALDLGVDGTEFVSSDNSLEAQQLMVHYHGLDSPEQSVAVTSLPQVLDTDLLPNSTTTLGLSLNIPSGTTSGQYKGVLSILGIGN